MALILNLETATKVCSVSLAKNGQEIRTVEISTEHFSHSENLNPFIESIFKNSEYQLKQIDAVAISAGPGSYTGLRIGASTAKGICYALDKPLLAINSLQSLANLIQNKTDYFLCPLFDAMRMEVYAAIFNEELNIELATSAVVVESKSFESFLAQKKVLFFGPGAAKCQSLIQHPNAVFDLSTQVSAKGMIHLSENKFGQNDFEDVAYFEPFYLKEFIAGESKKLI